MVVKIVAKSVYSDLKIWSSFCRFNVNFLAGPDNAFTFDVRFNYGNDRSVLVRNAMQHGTWGNEERHQPSFPFAYNKYFDMIILVEPECYKV